MYDCFLFCTGTEVIAQFKTSINMIGSHTRLRENDNLSPLASQPIKKNHFFNVRALIPMTSCAVRMRIAILRNDLNQQSYVPLSSNQKAGRGRVAVSLYKGKRLLFFRNFRSACLTDYVLDKAKSFPKK